MTWTKLFLTAAMRNQSLLLPIRELIEKWILNPWRIAIWRKFPAAVNGAVIQSQAKADLGVAGISIVRESAAWEEKYDASIFMQGLKSIWDLEENKNAVLLSWDLGACDPKTSSRLCLKFYH